MRVKQLLVLPNLPEKLGPLQEMANNLWYCWNWEVVQLFIRLDPDIWEESHQNPVEMLSRLPQEILSRAAEDEAFLNSLNKIYEKYEDYLKRNKWFHQQYSQYEDRRIAYFSLEYGLDTGLPVYSGGLGVLSGDTLKSASDLGLPMVAVGLLYRYGYFRQFLSSEGWQQERYEENDWYHMPVELVKDEHDRPLKVSVHLDNVPVQLQIWKVKVGLVPLYLLDTNIAENSSKAREVTSVLYGGDKDMRIRQEIILGIGGVRALRALGLNPSIYHINEGHSWFLTLERIKMLMEEHQLSFREAAQYVWSTTTFTTHTPVPAGNEKFDPVLVHRYLGDHVKQLGLSWQEFLSIGRMNPDDELEHFGMTVAALRSSAFANSVSQLHGVVSRHMWHNLWPGLPVEEVPIRAITNGVHPASWISHNMKELFVSYLGPQVRERPGDLEVWKKVLKIPDVELWRVHNRRRERLVFFARKQLRKKLERQGASQIEIQRADQMLDPHVLTIGFARRFSTYKRGGLLFSDPDRLDRIVNDEERPVQIIVAGKAHPLDNPGKEIIRDIVKATAEDRFRQRIVFLEDYDINLARYLVQGCDVWLNNPRRPQEASGTSGMKAALNGAVNLSVLDGWWVEGYDDEAGFKIGNGEEYDNVVVQDQVESEALYSALEREVVPLFYSRNDIDLPDRWITMMKNSIHMAGERFSAQRMLMDYTNQFYIPALDSAAAMSDNGFALDREVTKWLDRVTASWDKISIIDISLPELGSVVQVGTRIPVKMKVKLGDLAPEDVAVEIVAGHLDSQERFTDFSPAMAGLNGSSPDAEGIYTYAGEVVCQKTGRFGISARVIPQNEHLLHTRRPKLINWW
ncbi:MAG: alpha-glucan family phosphorylase [Candidatus Zixiibacteriota bacterium]|nr:MAG: alpha-glucan family phosphorylase [candidate division Zixibacteria bacterium]